MIKPSSDRLGLGRYHARGGPRVASRSRSTPCARPDVCVLGYRPRSACSFRGLPVPRPHVAGSIDWGSCCVLFLGHASPWSIAGRRSRAIRKETDHDGVRREETDCGHRFPLSRPRGLHALSRRRCEPRDGTSGGGRMLRRTASGVMLRTVAEGLVLRVFEGDGCQRVRLPVTQPVA